MSVAFRVGKRRFFLLQTEKNRCPVSFLILQFFAAHRDKKSSKIDLSPNEGLLHRYPQNWIEHEQRKIILLAALLHTNRNFDIHILFILPNIAIRCQNMYN